MYSIYLKAPREDPLSVLVYDDTIIDNSYALLDLMLKFDDSAAGSLEFEVPLTNLAYQEFTPFSKDAMVYVYKTGYKNIYGNEGTDDTYWCGRIATIDRGIDNHKSVYCEGVLSFLNDTTQTPGIYKTETSDNDDFNHRNLHLYLGYLLNRHNQQVDASKQIWLGETTVVYEPTTWYTNFEQTMTVFEDIANATNGHLRIRRSIRNGHSAWVLDLLNDDIWVLGETDSNGIVMTLENKWRYLWVPNFDQQLEYGVNLTDLDQSQSIFSVVTAVYALGKRKDTSSIEGIDEYKTIDGCDTSKIPASIRPYISIETDSQGFKYIKSSLADTIGYISSVVNYDDVENATELMLLGILELTLPGSISYEVTAQAVDLSYKDRLLKPIEIYDVIDVISSPHELVSAMKVSKAEIPLANPIETKFEIGTSKTMTFTELSNRRMKNVNSEIKYLTTKPYVEPEPPEESEE